MNTDVFGQLSPKTPNVGKPVQQMRIFIFIFRNGKYIYGSLMSKEKLANTWLNFLDLPDKFRTLRVTSFILCVIQCESSAQSLFGLHDSAWRGSCCWSAHPSLHPPEICFLVADFSVLLLLQLNLYKLTHLNRFHLLQNWFPSGTKSVLSSIPKRSSSLFL